MPGVEVEVQPVRNYPYHTLGSHVFGYVGRSPRTNTSVCKRRRLHAQRRRRQGRPRTASTTRCCAARRAASASSSTRQGQLVRRLGPTPPVPGDSSRLGDRLAAAADRRARAADGTRRAASGRAPARRRRRRDRPLRRRRVGARLLSRLRSERFRHRDQGSDLSRDCSPTRCSRCSTAAIGAATADGLDLQDDHRQRRDLVRRHRANQVLYDSGAWECHGDDVPRYRRRRARHDRLRPRAGRIERRLFLSTRRPARARAPALLRAQFGLAKSPASTCPANSPATGRPTRGR